MLPMETPIFANDDAFFCRFFTEIGAHRDTSGRPLHEVDFRAEEHKEAFSVCPFNDSRKGYLINKDALTQITSEWQDVVDGVRYFKRLFDGPDRIQDELVRSWVVSLAAMFAPLYLFNRQENTIKNGALPTPVAGVFKIMLDVPTTIDLMLMERAGAGLSADGPAYTVSAIRKFADERLILVNGDYACAGSPKLIDNILSIMTEPSAPMADSPAGFAQLMGNTGPFMPFCHLMSIQYVAGLIYIITTTIVARHLRYLTRIPPQISAHAATAEQTMRPAAYARRSQIMMEMMGRSDHRRAALTLLVNIVKDGRPWKNGDKTSACLEEFLDESLALAASIHLQHLRMTFELYTDYQKRASDMIRDLQNKIEATIGAPNMFPPSPIFGNPSRHPVLTLIKNFEAV